MRTGRSSRVKRVRLVTGRAMAVIISAAARMAEHRSDHPDALEHYEGWNKRHQ